MASERIQKLLAHAGYGSRRACEKIIEAGRIRVNGKVAKLGDKADLKHDVVELDGQQIGSGPELIYIALNKPRFVISSAESQGGHKTVLDVVKSPHRLYPVGRLDLESEGLMLLTNDGDLANRLTHPRYGHEKEYRVLVAKRPDEKQLDTWRRGIFLEDGYETQPVDVEFERTHGKGAWLRVIMTEGRKRQIRETARLVGLPVVKLIRVRIGTLHLGRLNPGDFRNLFKDEIASLYGKKAGPKKRKGNPKPRKY